MQDSPSKSFTEEEWLLMYIFWDYTTSNLADFGVVNRLHLPDILTRRIDRLFEEMHFSLSFMYYNNFFFHFTKTMCFYKDSVEIQSIHHDKMLKAIVYYLSVLKQSFQCSSSSFYLFLVWFCFLSASSTTCLLTFLREINLAE